MCRIAAMLFVLSFACPLFAQEGSATLTGFIQDSSKAVIPGVKVTAIDTSTNQRFVATTGKDGSYTIVSLPVGPYQMQIEKPGFKTILKDDLFLHTQDALEVNFQMAVGSTSETVTVNGSATNDSPAVSLVVNRDFVENMPLNGRSIEDLLALAPGVVSAGDGSGLFSVNGQRTDANYFTVDGVSSNSDVGLTSTFGAAGSGNYSPGVATAGMLPSQTALGTTQSLISVDALQEFRVQTSGYSAEYGRQPGGQIEFTTRSGSDHLHGSLFDYFRNDALDANSWFGNYNDIPRQAERQNDFGGTVGGPLPRFRFSSKSNPTFYFVSYEGLRLVLPSYLIETVPTVAFRQAIAPGWQPLFNSLPLPNGTDNNDPCLPEFTTNNTSCSAQFHTGYSTSSSLDAFSLRIDQPLGRRVQIFGRYATTPSQSSMRNPAAATEIDSNVIADHSVTLGTTINITRNAVDELRFNFSDNSGQSGAKVDSLAGSVPYSPSLLIPANYAPSGTPSGDFLFLAPQGVNGQLAIPSYNTQNALQRQINVVDSYAWTERKHLLKVGIDYRRLSPVLSPFQFESFIDQFSTTGLQQGVADYLGVEAYRGAHPTFINLSAYIQDNWKMTRKLLVTYGIRWEFNPAPGASDGVYPLALTSANLNSATIQPAGTPVYHTSYDHFAPRFGFAYTAHSAANHQFVVRGGFGIFYDTGQNLGASGYSGFPFSNSTFLSNVNLPASATALAPPSLNVSLAPPYTGFLTGLSNPNLTLPYTEQWNLSLDQSLSAKNTLTMSYVGNNGRRLLVTFDEYPNNQVFQSLSAITTNAASSTYHSLQLQDQGYVAPGMQLIASYSWLHAIDDASTEEASGFDLLVRGNSAYDIRQSLNVAANYNIPNTTKAGIVGAIGSGWLAAVRAIGQSGYPFDIFQGFYTVPVSGVSSPIRPNLVAGVPIYLNNVSGVPGGWRVNPSAFSLVNIDPTTGLPLTIGTLGRNQVHGPNIVSLNTSVQRTFPIADRVKVDFRVDAFNIVNHPNFGDVNNFFSPTNPGFGDAQGTQTIGNGNALYATGAARSLQLSLKVHF